MGAWLLLLPQGRRPILHVHVIVVFGNMLQPFANIIPGSIVNCKEARAIQGSVRCRVYQLGSV
jgi:hypothetical protein